MASKQEKEDGSVNTQTFACSPGQIPKKEEDEEGWLSYGAFLAHRCAQGCCGSVCRLASCKLRGITMHAPV